MLTFGFFAHFEPVSYASHADLTEPDLVHLGYEADLLTALESMADTGLHFRRVPIAEWPDIWLAPASDWFDLAGGGISILDSRTRDDGRTVVAFTDGHIGFRQTLLVRAADASRIRTHDDLGASDTIGAVAGTTGEARLLQLIGVADERGVLLAGTQVETPQGTVTADGGDAFRITAADPSAEFDQRTNIVPPGDLPRVAYLGDDDALYLDALADGRIDAFARGEIGNTDAARDSSGAFVVTAFDPQVERAGFVVAVEDLDLLELLNERINWLTDGGRIGYAEWSFNPAVFSNRAQRWNAKR
ncbi:MAG: transporter substrate-binding domain-containing protein [Chloroflexi bacterium]|nr:transporter substrate-binding domain-containing protein [Chloroflexota bacterium]